MEIRKTAENLLPAGFKTSGAKPFQAAPAQSPKDVADLGSSKSSAPGLLPALGKAALYTGLSSARRGKSKRSIQPPIPVGGK